MMIMIICCCMLCKYPNYNNNKIPSSLVPDWEYKTKLYRWKDVTQMRWGREQVSWIDEAHRMRHSTTSSALHWKYLRRDIRIKHPSTSHRFCHDFWNLFFSEHIVDSGILDIMRKQLYAANEAVIKLLFIITSSIIGD